MPKFRCNYLDVAEKWRGGCHNPATENGFCYAHGGITKRAQRKELGTLTSSLLLFAQNPKDDFNLVLDGKLQPSEAMAFINRLNQTDSFTEAPIYTGQFTVKYQKLLLAVAQIQRENT